MISAFKHNKIKIDVCEDSLTSCIFDFLFLLPSSLFWKILRKAIIVTPENNKETIPKEKIGQLEHYEFWPHWDPLGTENVNYVEPDVFIRFSEYDVIIEAKRYEIGQQDPLQWKKEITGYRNEYGKDKKRSYLIALGGLRNNNKKQIKGIPIFQCRWSSILDIICKILENERNGVIRLILKLVLRYFEIHGYVQIKWLEELSAGDKLYKNYIKSNSQSISFLLSHNDFKNYFPFPGFSTLKPVLKKYNQSISILKTTWEEWK
jgi:hypothetical protein